MGEFTVSFPRSLLLLIKSLKLLQSGREEGKRDYLISWSQVCQCKWVAWVGVGGCSSVDGVFFFVWNFQGSSS